MTMCSSVIEEHAAPAVVAWRILRWVPRMMWLGLVGIALWMLEAYLLPQDLRETNLLYGALVYVSFVGRVLRFHLAIAASVIAIVALLMRRRWMALVGATLSAILLWPTLVSLWPKPPAPAAGTSLRVMSINLLVSNRNGDAILEQIDRANPDVIAIQEYSHWADELLRSDLTEYPHRLLEPEFDSTGVALYSKIPFQAELQYPHNALGTRLRLRAELTLDGRQVVLYAIHPSSPHYYTNIIRNRLQTADLLNAINNETSPVVIAGDFNATETTANLEAYQTLGFHSTHDLAGSGRQTTWPDITPLKYLPGFRIDHILISPELTCTMSKVCGPTGSDHRPVVADLGFAKSLAVEPTAKAQATEQIRR